MEAAKSTNNLGVRKKTQRNVRSGDSVNTGVALKHNNAIGKVGGHDEIVFNNKGCLFGMHDEAFDDLGTVETLLGVQVGRGFVD